MRVYSPQIIEEERISLKGFEWFIANMITMILYFVFARIGAQLGLPPSNVTPVFPASGIALGALLLTRRETVLGVAMGAFGAASMLSLSGVATSTVFYTAISSAVGASMQAWLGAYLIEKVAGTLLPLKRVHHVFFFLLLGALLACLVNASLGIMTLRLLTMISPEESFNTWVTWWLGDVMGVAIVAPVIIMWRIPFYIGWSKPVIFESIFLLIFSVTAGYFVFKSQYPIIYLMIPMVVWAAYRFEQHGAATLSLIISGQTIWAAMSQMGSFSLMSLNETLLTLQAFMGVVNGMSLILAALVSGQKRAEYAILMANEQLEEKVAQRTQEVVIQKNQIEEQKHEIEKKSNAMTSSIIYARRIQEAMLPGVSELSASIPNSFAFFRPKDIVSGDFLWFADLGKKKIIIAADCTGHGVPGAFMTIMANDLLNEIIFHRKYSDPQEILYRLDEKVLNTLQKGGSGSKQNDGMDLSILCIHQDEGYLEFAAAKNPLYYVRNNEIHAVKGSKFPIGSSQFKIEKTFEKHRVDILPGDIFYIFSDGFQDQFGGEDNRKYMSGRFRQFIHGISSYALEEQEELLQKEFLMWKGDRKQTDDIIIVGIRF